MVKYLLASHGRFASGTKNFLSIMGGDSERIVALDAFLDERSLEEKIEEAFSKIGDFEQCFIFTDIHGGSVEQEIFRKFIRNERNIKMISGYNLSLILEIVLADRILSDNEIEKIIQQSKETIIFLNKMQDPNQEEDLF